MAVEPFVIAIIVCAYCFIVIRWQYLEVESQELFKSRYRNESMRVGKTANKYRDCAKIFLAPFLAILLVTIMHYRGLTGR